MPSSVPRWLQYGLPGVLLLAALYLVFMIFQSGQPLIALGLLAVSMLFAFVYLSPRAYTWRYLFPGLFGFGAFVILPLAYTAYIGFTQYDSQHLLSFASSRRAILQEDFKTKGSEVDFRLFRQTSGDYRILFTAGDEQWLSSREFPLVAPPKRGPAPAATESPIPLENWSDGTPEGTPLELRDLTSTQLYRSLATCSFEKPDGSRLVMDGLRRFADRKPLWVENKDQQLVNQLDGQVITPDFDQGFYRDEAGEAVGFGFRNWYGFGNYERIVRDERIRKPFFRIFIWTMAFALGSVILTFAVGMSLAVLLEWEDLRFRKLYRTLLILPYAVPAFLSILIFKGMFNQEFGAVNEVLNNVFGIAPDWNTSPNTARLMVLIVNVWLGYPYMMIIATGVLQSIPRSIYEASSIDGSNVFHDFFKLTLPLIIPPLMPLLIASFAFNFNNFNLIYLLTAGSPKMVEGGGTAGETDILVTYTFNLAFQDAGKDYGLASAIATLLFFIVGFLAWQNLRLTQRNKP